MKWSKEEDAILTKNYQLKKIDLLKLLPNRTQSAINLRASKLRLKKVRNEYCKSKSDVLLKNNLESYYWIGFILADGSIIDNRICVSLSNKDKQHICKFGKYIECTNIIEYDNFIRLSFQDKYIVPKIKCKFDIKQNKTYNPPCVNNYSIFHTNQLLAILIGYIDGDGCLRKQSNNRNDSLLTIQIHSSWLLFLQMFHNLLESILDLKISKPYINKRGYAIWSISNSIVLTFLKKYITKHKIPSLERKWNNVDTNIVNKIHRRDTINSLKDNGYSNIKISKMMNISLSSIYRILKGGVQ